jgi:hypothetical protein
MHRYKTARAYRKTNEVYPLLEAMAAACAVYREFGFVRRGQNYIDHKSNMKVAESREIVLNTLRPEDQRDEKIHVATITDEDREHAAKVCRFFDQKTMIAKLSDDINEYDEKLIEIFGEENVDHARDLSMIASLPNSYVIQERRDAMEEFYLKNKHIGSYVGKPKERVKVEAKVLDAKWIPKNNIYLVTMVTDNDQIVKFFLKDNDVDVSERLRDQRITFVGAVRDQQISEYTGCHETMFNRVKIEK